MRAIGSIQVPWQGPADDDVHTRCQDIAIQLRAKAFNLLTSTSFFFLVMLFFWSFSGWGAALLTGGLRQRVAGRNGADQGSKLACRAWLAKAKASSFPFPPHPPSLGLPRRLILSSSLAHLPAPPERLLT